MKLQLGALGDSMEINMENQDVLLIRNELNSKERLESQGRDMEDKIAFLLLANVLGFRDKAEQIINNVEVDK